MANNPRSNSNKKMKQQRYQDSEGVWGGGEPEVWASFDKNFKQVQSVLDRNRVSIQQVNNNHQSKLHDNMVENVALIQELNGNISKVVSLYSDFSSDFSNVFSPNHNDDSSGSAATRSRREG